VLVHAAAAGGHLAVQITKARSAYVIGTARSDKHGFLRVVLDQVLPLQEAAKAHELSETGRVKGKIVLTVR